MFMIYLMPVDKEPNLVKFSTVSFVNLAYRYQIAIMQRHPGEIATTASCQFYICFES